MTFGSPYRPGREIARGGMGAVLDARDQKLGRSVAMKVMLRRNASEEEQQRFLQEARVLGQLAHPNIVPVHDVGTDEQGRLFYTMKLVVGVTLHDVIGKLKAGDKDTLAKYPLNALLTGFQKICDAVAFAHSRGIIHRDLKPQNIMVGEFGEVLVMDWGLAKILPGSAAAEEAAKTLPLRGQLGQTGPTGTLPLNSPAAEDQATLVAGSEAIDQATVASGTGGDSAPKLAFGSQQPEPAAPSGVYATLEGAVMGTPHYMSPEQAEGKIAELDGRSDIFSLGGILYSLLTLRPPVEGDSLEEILSKVRSGTIAPPTAFNAPSSTPQANLSATGTVTEPRKICPLPHCPDGKVPPALSAVTMKALTRDKLRRYQTVAEFTRDIEAYQGGFATSAENANALTLVRLFIHRHKALTGAASVIVLLTIGFMAKVISSEQKAKAEASRAREAEAVAEQKEKEARKALAKSALSLAEAAMREADGPAMQAALNDVPDDLRDSTWSYLLAQSDSSIARLRTGTAAMEGAAADPSRPGIFAVADRNKQVTIINVRTGERLLAFQPGFSRQNNADQYRLAFSPDGQRLAVGRDGPGGMVIHQARDGAKVREWATPASVRVEFGDHEKLLRHGGKSLQVWNSSTGNLLWEHKAADTLGVVGNFIPGRSEVLKMTGQTRLQVVSPSDGSLIRNLGGRAPHYTWFMAVHPDGRSAITHTDTRISECVSLTDGKVLYTLPQKHARRWMGFTADGEQLVTLSVQNDGGQLIEVWNARTGSPIRSLLGGQGAAAVLSVHPRSHELLVSGANARVWDLTGQVPNWHLPSYHMGTAAFWGSDDLLFSTASGPNSWGLQRLTRSGTELVWQPTNRNNYTTAVSANGDVAVVARPGSSTDAQLLRKSGDTVEQFGELKVGFWPYRLRPSPNGKILVAMARVTTPYAEVLDTGTGKHVFTIPEPKRVNDMGWLGNERLVGLLTLNAARGNAGSDECIRLWDVTTGKVLQTITNRTAMDVLAVAPDGKRFAEAGADKLIRIRDAATLQVQNVFRAHDAPITVLAWHPTKPMIASGSEDLSIKVLDFEKGRLIHEFRGLLNPPDYISFSPTGKRLAVKTTSDNLIRIWRLDEEAATAQRNPGTNYVATSSSTPNAATAKPGEWEDLLAAFTPAIVEQTGNGWRMDNGALFSPNKPFATLPLPGNLSGTSYTVRVKLRQLTAKNGFSLELPVGNRMVGFDLDGSGGKWTSLALVNGKFGKNLPSSLSGKQVKDSDQHTIEVTVSLTGSDALIASTLDDQPLYEWTGPTATLSQYREWQTAPGTLALGTMAADWVVYEVKVKRLDAK